VFDGVLKIGPSPIRL